MRYVRRRRRRHRIQLFQTATSGSLEGSLALRRGRLRDEGEPIAKARLFSGLLLLLLGGLLGYFFISYDFYVYDAEIVGTELVSPQEVFEASGIEGLSIFYAEPSEIEARLKQRLSVREVHARCVFPNRVRIILQERKAAFVWQQGDQAWGVDEEGVLLPLSQAASWGGPLEGMLWVEDPRPLPGEQDQQLRERLDRELVTSVLAVKKLLPEITCLRCDPRYGLGFQTARGYQVWLGRGQIERKVAVWQALESDLSAHGIQPACIDLRFPDSPGIALAEAKSKE